MSLPMITGDNLEKFYEIYMKPDVDNNIDCHSRFAQAIEQPRGYAKTLAYRIMYSQNSCFVIRQQLRTSLVIYEIELAVRRGDAITKEVIDGFYEKANERYPEL